ncbi:checkpoint clamp complex protein Rad1 [Coemansia sp. BCRC 34962]|nr:checkpoint clamp complex protein Rad1 [Coemansia sp. BCRC 34962]
MTLARGMTAEPDSMLFRAKLANVRPLVNMLKTISFRPRTCCVISPDGLVFTVDESQCLVAQAYLRSEIFTAFSYDLQLAEHYRNQEQESFEDEVSQGGEQSDTTQVVLSLDNLIECLTLFYGPSSAGNAQSTALSTSSLYTPGNPGDLRGATTAIIGFKGPGADLELMLEERGTISECRLSTFVPEPPVDLQFSHYPTTQQLIIRSEWLRDAFNELDSTSESVYISIASTEPHFRISTIGESGSTDMTYSNSERILDSFFCNEDQENKYKLSLILKCKQALAMSEKTKIRINQRGFLSLQFMIPTAADVSFVNFVFAPLVSTDEPAAGATARA